MPSFHADFPLYAFNMLQEGLKHWKLKKKLLICEDGKHNERCFHFWWKIIKFCGWGKFKLLKKIIINFFRLHIGITLLIKYLKIVINPSLMAWESI